jgi:predicted HicB family RNase H-like nuclease
MNIMTIDSYKAKIQYDAEIDMFRGEILGLNGGADFYGNSLSELREEFKKSLKIFLEICQEKGIPAIKEYSGKFNLRIPPKLHSEVAVQAITEEKSINQWVTDTLEQRIQA